MINNNQSSRSGCRDIWNAFMVKDAIFSTNDIPFCPTTATAVPKNLISYVEAKSIYKREIKSKNCQFHNNAFVHFYIDDYKFDSTNSGIWSDPYSALEVLKHFEGVVTPDFSTYADFPDPLKRWNTYRMRAYGLWLSTYGIQIINNVRWGEPETWEYCFDGLPSDSIFCIGTIASGLKEVSNRQPFTEGLLELISRKNPHTLIIYGSANYSMFNDLKNCGINIVPFASDISVAYERRRPYV